MSEMQATVGNKLLISQIIFRHGARTPLFTLPRQTPNANSDLYSFENKSYGRELFYPFPQSQIAKLQLVKPHGDRTKSQIDMIAASGRDPYAKLPGGALYGDLTTLGRTQLYELGRKVFDMKLVNFSSVNCLRNMIVHSSFVSRTLDSVQSFLSGFISKWTDTNGFSDALKEEAIVPINVESFDRDFIFPNGYLFSVLNRDPDEMFSKLSEDNVLRRTREQFFKQYSFQKPEFGLLEIFDEIASRQAHKLPMSDDLRKWRQTLGQLVHLEYNHLHGHGMSHSDYLKTTVGLFLRRLLNNMTDADSSSEPRLFVYSCHDSTVHCLNMAFGQQDIPWPDYASYILLRLFQRQDGSKYVTVTYNDQDLAVNKEQECDLTKFLNLVNQYALDEDEILTLNEATRDL